MVTAKLLVREITSHGGGAETVTLAMVDCEGIPEERRLQQTPSGLVSLYVDNPEALKFFQAGKEVWLDFSDGPITVVDESRTAEAAQRGKGAAEAEPAQRGKGAA